MNSSKILLGLPIYEDDDYHGSGNGSRHTGGYRTNISLASKRIPPAGGTTSIDYDGDSHLITIAPTGAGKGRSAIIPNLLEYLGPVIVVDPKGENYAVTARARREMGQDIVLLDPFGICDVHPEDRDSFNPFDILSYAPTMLNDDARMLAELLMTDDKSLKEPFWDNWASSLLSGAVIYYATQDDDSKKNMLSVRDVLYGDNPTYKLAVLADTDKEMDSEAYQEITSFLNINAEVTRAGVLSTAQQHVRLFGSPAVRNGIAKTTFDLNSVYHGDQVSLYIVIPPTKLRSHQPLLRLWVGALLSLIVSRTRIPPQKTLFIIDEAAQLGHLNILQTAKTLLRGYGLQAWSFWQDLSQIKQLYPTGWATMLNNCDVIQLFGPKNFLVAKEFAEIAGVDAHEVRNLKPDEQVLLMGGHSPVRTLRHDYLMDDLFAGRFDPNPLYDSD
jgi:type IV secretion system protein VirD4